jgi:hypothetical protein
VLSQCEIISGENPEKFRKDEHDNTIRYTSYGTNGVYGWHVDHRNPVSKKGTNHKRNLRALHWEANLAKSDKYPYP